MTLSRPIFVRASISSPLLLNPRIGVAKALRECNVAGGDVPSYLAERLAVELQVRTTPSLDQARPALGDEAL
jgi:hypothetical protein